MSIDVSEQWVDELQTYVKWVAGVLLERAEGGNLSHMRVSIDVQPGELKMNDKAIRVTIETSKFSSRKWIGDGYLDLEDGFEYGEVKNESL